MGLWWRPVKIFEFVCANLIRSLLAERGVNFYGVAVRCAGEEVGYAACRENKRPFRGLFPCRSPEIARFRFMVEISMVVVICIHVQHAWAWGRRPDDLPGRVGMRNLRYWGRHWCLPSRIDSYGHAYCRNPLMILFTASSYSMPMLMSFRSWSFAIFPIAASWVSSASG